MTDKISTASYTKKLVVAASSSFFLAVLATMGVLAWAGWLSLPEDSRQTAVHDMGVQVMPFDLGQTTHIFEMTQSGGIQQVVARDPGDEAQIALIQQHIQHEVLRFKEGDFSDPSTLHGGDMPGVPELTGGAGQISIEYTALADGAQITFTTEDAQLITAIHRWFGAQLSDHGADATTR